MAMVRKRKANAYAVDGDDDTDEITITIKVESNNNDAIPQASSKKRRRTYKKKPKIRVPSYDVWNTLPGELKNKIYTHVLVEDSTQTIGVGAVRCGYGAQRSRRWPQPALLSVSKQIHRESMSVYYRSNVFVLSVQPKHFNKGIKWIKNISATVGHEDLAWSMAATSWTWSGIASWFSVALFIFQTDIFKLDEEDDFADDHAHEDLEIQSWHRTFSLDKYYCHYPSLEATFREMIELTVKAKFRGFDIERFERDFKDWAWKRHETRLGRSFMWDDPATNKHDWSNALTAEMKDSDD